MFSVSAAAEKNVEKYELTLESNDFENRRARFKFYDASKGCPSYNDLPGAQSYLGSAKVKGKGSVKQLPGNRKIHVFYFRPSLTPEITAKGGSKEVRRRSVQIVIMSNMAKLELIKDASGGAQWIGSGDITVEAAVNCIEVSDK
ncbi:MAG: hypothetical protein P8R04_05355 [Gammaproteobacteria bacterium]|nr:hypothetical protein [Gammaproteobacteria bacterium]